MKCHFFLMINGAPFPLPIHIWLREKDYPVSMSPIIMVDPPQGILLFSMAILGNYMYNPDCRIVLDRGYVNTYMINHWNQVRDSFDSYS